MAMVPTQPGTQTHHDYQGYFGLDMHRQQSRILATLECPLPNCLRAPASSRVPWLWTTLGSQGISPKRTATTDAKA